MPQVEIPITTYQVKQNRPGNSLGSPGRLTLRTVSNGTHRVYMRVPIDKIPVGAIVTSAVIQVWTALAKSGSVPISIYPITSDWKSSIKWSKQPTVGALITTTTIAGPAKNALYSFDVMAWLATKNRNGLELTSSVAAAVSLNGSSAAVNKPVLVVNYVVPALQPANLSPQGGFVSVSKPILSFTGDQDMDHMQIQYSSDGTVGGITFDTTVIPATTGRYVPAAGVPALAAGGTTYWRVQTTTAGRPSAWSPWVSYSYRPITPPVITNPPANTNDGSPPVTWTVADQVSWKAELWDGSKLISKSEWDVDGATRDWTPGAGVAVPNGSGRIVLRTTDSYTPRVAAEGAPIWSQVEKVFTTVLGGAGPGITNLAISYDGPIPVLTGTRALGIPDEIALVRDGKIVTIWDDDGVPHSWSPAVDFFSGTNFAIPDFTADPRQQHTWSVLTRVGGVASAVGLQITDTFSTGSVWIVDPRTGVRIEILGNNEKPVVSQLTEEGSILHTPVRGDLVVEPVRRRLMRTTRSGSIDGLVLNNDENTLEDWALSDSGLKYRLIFGKVNWPIIFGDYSPTDVFYTHPDPECDDTLVLIALNWWERLND